MLRARSSSSSSAAGRSSSSRTTPPSVERLCQRAVLLRDGRVELDGSAQEAIARYHTLLADERDPAESAAGLREYGSGEVRIAEARLLGPEGEERQQLAAGEPLAVELRIDVREAVPPPRVSLELRDEAGLLLAAAAQDTAELGWARGAGRARAPLRGRAAAARRRPLPPALRARRPGLAAASTIGSTTRSGSSSTRASGARGPVLLDGTWSLQEIGAAAEVEDDELPDLPRLARADGDRARSPVQALHRPRGAAARGGADEDPGA